MTRILCLVFLVMAILGVVMSKLAVTIIAVFMIGFMLYGEHELAKRDAEFFATPAGAKQIADTLQLLVQQQCECAASRF